MKLLPEPGPTGVSALLRMDLVLHLVRREFQVRYRRSVLGGLWALAQPLARLAVLSFLFTRVLPLGIEDYTAFLFVGLTGWMWFSSGVLAGCASPVERRELILRPGLPRAVIPLVAVLSTGIDYLAALPVLLLFVAFTTGLSAHVLLLPLVLLLQLLLTLGLALALAAANVFVRDVRIVTEVVMLLGFYVTPVFFSPDQVPPQFSALVTLNPVAGLLEMQRDLLVRHVLPSAGEVISSAVVCAAAALAGYLLYRRASVDFADEL